MLEKGFLVCWLMNFNEFSFGNRYSVIRINTVLNNELLSVVSVFNSFDVDSFLYLLNE